jgi:hypothetical protein
VPLSQTAGYQGMIKRAKLPTADRLGFDPAYSSVDAAAIVAVWLPLLDKAFEREDADAILELMDQDEPWWKVGSTHSLIEITRLCRTSTC